MFAKILRNFLFICQSLKLNIVIFDSTKAMVSEIRDQPKPGPMVVLVVAQGQLELIGPGASQQCLRGRHLHKASTMLHKIIRGTDFSVS